MTTRRHTKTGFMLWFSILTVIACVIGLIASGSIHVVAEALGSAADSAVDHVLFDSPEQIAKYKEMVK